MNMRLFLLLLIIFASVSAKADGIQGHIYSADYKPLAEAYVTVKYKVNGKILSTGTADGNGFFVFKDLPKAPLIISCSHIGYLSYEAEVDMAGQKELDLGVIILKSKDTALNEVVILGERNVYTSNKQIVYPSKSQIQTSGSGFDLLQKLPIPFLEVDPVSRKISSLDPSGSIQIRINDIIADDNDLAILDPRDIKRIVVIRKPGMKYGTNLALVIDILMKRREDGFSSGGNLSNSVTLTNGANNLYAAYNHKNSQLTVNQSENYQNFKRMSSEENRSYLMPDGSTHRLRFQSLPSRLLTLTHGTLVKYNLSVADKHVFQVQAYLNIHKNPKQLWSQNVSEDGVEDYTTSTKITDSYNSPALNLYFKKYLPEKQELTFNVVGTYIQSKYNYAYEQQKQAYGYAYSVKGDKYSFISEVKYNKEWDNYQFAAGVRNDVSTTQNKYSGTNHYDVHMDNLNTDAYIQLDAQWRKFSGRINLGVDDQHYFQDRFKFHKFTIRPGVSVNLTASPHLSFSYNFSLRPQLPNISYQNHTIIQLDKWERKAGNPDLRPFNHIENSLSMAYQNSKMYFYLSMAYAGNKNAIMPITYRTIAPDGQVHFDHSSANQPGMNQMNIMSYLRYKLIGDKLVAKGNGGFNRFYANGSAFTNRKSFFYGDFTLESYLGNWYLSSTIASRYIAFFAETTWYNEYVSSISATYNYKNIQVGLLWSYPLQKKGYNTRQATDNAVIHKEVYTENPDKSNLVVLNFVWRWNSGKKSHAKEADLNNKDTDAGILK